MRPLLLAAGASEAVRLSDWSAPLRLQADSTAPPEALAALVRHVEQETELVPGVRRVAVLGRGDGWVRYQVEGVACGVPWDVRFRKEWELDPGDPASIRFRWHAEGGTGRPEQSAELLLRPADGGTRLELTARTRSDLPLLGGLATLLVNPLFLTPTFAGWLRNLTSAAEAEAR
jgi:hypothetical protein